MVIIGRINEFKRGDCDFTLAIVRSFKGSSDWIQQVPQLSPSPELFRDYVRVWKPLGRWNCDTFENEYMPRFLRQIADDPQGVGADVHTTKNADYSRYFKQFRNMKTPV